MKLLLTSSRKLRRVILVCLLAGASPIVFLFLHAQTSHAPPDSTSTGATANDASETPISPALLAANTPAASGTTTGATNSATAQGSTNAPSPTAATNAPGSENMMEEPGAVSSGPPAPEPAPSAAQGVNGEPGTMSEAAPGEPANSSEVQPVTNSTGLWDSLWQKGSPLHFGLDIGETYDDNILISPNKTSSFLTHISPSFDFQKGEQTAPHMNYLNIYFAPTVFLYQSHSEFDRFDLDGDLYYQYNWTRLSVGIEQHYQRLTDANLDVGNLVKRDIYTTAINANYSYNDDLTIYGSATQQISDYPGVTFNEWTVDSYALYQLAPKLQIGAGPRVTFMDIGGAPNETHEDFLVRMKYLPDTRFTLGCNAGVEYLEYQNDDDPSHVLPILDFDLGYSPADGTYLYAVAGRASSSSYDILGQTIVSTQVQIGARQRFLQNFHFTVSAGYTLADYEFGKPTESVESGTRKDDYYFAKGGVEWEPNTWLDAQLSYQWSEDRSSFGQNSFSDNQVDIQASVHF